MNSENRMPDLDPVFADALRGALVAQASVAAPRRPARRRWWAGVGALGAHGRSWEVDLGSGGGVGLDLS